MILLVNSPVVIESSTTLATSAESFFSEKLFWDKLNGKQDENTR